MNCPNCGQENPPGAQFCNQCATRLAPPSDEEAPPTQLPDTSADFIGRQQEMTQLRDALADALSGQGRLVMLAGEPGIGKTRTAEELEIYAASQGFQTLWGRCYEGEGAPPYWSWVQILRDYVQQASADQLLAQLGPGAADIAEIIPELIEKSIRVHTILYLVGDAQQM